MPTLEEKIALAREERDAADLRFRETLREARANGEGMSWSQLAKAAGLSMHGVRYLVLELNNERQAAKKLEATASK